MCVLFFLPFSWLIYHNKVIFFLNYQKGANFFLLRIWESRMAWWRDGMKKSYHIVANFTAAKKSYGRMTTSYLKSYHVWRLLCKCGKRSLRHVIRLFCKCGKTSLCHVWRVLFFSFHTSSLNREFQCNTVAWRGSSFWVTRWYFNCC